MLYHLNKVSELKSIPKAGHVIAVEVENENIDLALQHLKSIFPDISEIRVYFPNVLTTKIPVPQNYIAITSMHAKPFPALFDLLKSYARGNNKIIFVFFRPARIVLLNQIPTGNVFDSYIWTI